MGPLKFVLTLQSLAILDLIFCSYSLMDHFLFITLLVSIIASLVYTWKDCGGKHE
jgi:hypothetical protein